LGLGCVNLQLDLLLGEAEVGAAGAERRQLPNFQGSAGVVATNLDAAHTPAVPVDVPPFRLRPDQRAPREIGDGGLDDVKQKVHPFCLGADEAAVAGVDLLFYGAVLREDFVVDGLVKVGKKRLQNIGALLLLCFVIITVTEVLQGAISLTGSASQVSTRLDTNPARVLPLLRTDEVLNIRFHGESLSGAG